MVGDEADLEDDEMIVCDDEDEVGDENCDLKKCVLFCNGLYTVAVGAAGNAKGGIQLTNLSLTTCGAEGDPSPARYESPILLPWGAKKLEGITTRGDANVVFILEGGHNGTQGGGYAHPEDLVTPKIHWFDLNLMQVFHSVEIIDWSENNKMTWKHGANALAWVPDGTPEGMFILGSHFDGKSWKYKINRVQTTATTLGRLNIPLLHPELSGMTYEPEDKNLWVLYHEDYWGFYIYDWNAHNQTVNVPYHHRKQLLANLQGGSPPFKHEGFAVYRMADNRTFKMFTADKHRYIYESRYRYNAARFVACPWVFVRVDCCCFHDKPGQNLPENWCKNQNGYITDGRFCKADTCVEKTGQYGCPNNTYFEEPDMNCRLCNSANPGCWKCNQHPSDPECVECHDGYYLENGVCPTCEVSAGTFIGITNCLSCTKGVDTLTCDSCFEGLPETDGLSCISCADPERGTANCSKCSDVENMVCERCSVGYYLDPVLKTCHPCTDVKSNCARCHHHLVNGQGIVTCDECDSTSRLHYHENRCVPSCPDGMYEKRVEGDGKTMFSGIKLCEYCEPDNFGMDCEALYYSNLCGGDTFLEAETKTCKLIPAGPVGVTAAVVSGTLLALSAIAVLAAVVAVVLVFSFCKKEEKVYPINEADLRVDEVSEKGSSTAKKLPKPPVPPAKMAKHRRSSSFKVSFES